MTLFEYLAIAFSLVFSFAVMRLVAGLPHAMDPDRRYWVHATLVHLQLVATAVTFWVFWSYRDVEWTLPRFLLVIGIPVLMYFNACALIPEAPDRTPSWRDYFYETARRRYFAGTLGWGTVVILATTFVLEMPWNHPARAVQALLVLVGAVGCASANPRLHAGIVVLLLVGAVPVVTLAIMARPGPLAP